MTIFGLIQYKTNSHNAYPSNLNFILTFIYKHNLIIWATLFLWIGLKWDSLPTHMLSWSKLFKTLSQRSIVINKINLKLNNLLVY